MSHKVYEINIPGVFHHRVAVSPEGKVTDPHAVGELRKNFFDYEYGFKDENFHAFLSHLKKQFGNRLALTEVPPDQAGSKLQPSTTEVSKDGLMVAFFLKPDDADALAQHGGEAPEELHLTLAFCGPRLELPEGAFEKAKAAVAEVAKTHGPISGHVTGTGRFNGQAGTMMGGATDCIYASFSSPELARFRERVVDAITRAGVPPKSTFGYTPHITLKYIPKDSHSPIRSVPRHNLTFDKISVACGPDQAHFSLAVS